MIYMLLVIGLMFALAIMPAGFTSIAAVFVLAISVQALAVMGAAYFVIGRVSFVSSLKAVVMSALFLVLAGLFALQVIDPAAVGAVVAIPLIFVVTYGAGILGISIGLRAKYGQAALIGLLYAIISWVVSSLLDIKNGLFVVA